MNIPADLETEVWSSCATFPIDMLPVYNSIHNYIHYELYLHDSSSLMTQRKKGQKIKLAEEEYPETNNSQRFRQRQ